MRKYLLGTALVAALAGCTADWDPGRESASATAPADNDAAKFQLPRDPAHSFASLPDQGALLEYDQTRKSRTAGAYTSRPVKISEAHAFNAIAKGEMILPGPDGQPIRLGYSSHEEHADGSWSWVGQDETGNSSVLTFGQDAVFGRIASGGEVFNVRTNASGAWLIQTDSTKLAGLGGQPTGADADFLAAPGSASISGVLDSAVASAAPSMASAEATTVASKAATVVVDLVLGYTNGLVTQAGSQSAALTQLNNLVATANQAYANSGINYRVRLVQAVLVNYADNNSNQDTLRKLTGYNEETKQSITVDAAFTALRAARDQYGGDLVSLVRPHRSPEQNGCGIAWLLGSGGSAITTAKDAAFGYSVVSVGVDYDESDKQNYLCSEDTLAHELGHNMGQVHNQENATTAGAHSYSYGYREASTTGFHTIMAYPLSSSSQSSILNFANPTVSVSGRATGVANASDNARSMNQTMPLVANFRSTVVPAGSAVRADMTGDGNSDILWRNTASQSFSHWAMSGNLIVSSAAKSMQSSYSVAGTGDFDGDGIQDVLWINDAGTYVIIWKSDGVGGYQQLEVGGKAAALKFSGIGDFNGDGRDDILWHDTVAGQMLYWAMNGRVSSPSQRVGMPAWFKIIAVGDFDGDGFADVAYRNSVDVNIYKNMKTTFHGQRLAYIPSGYSMLGVGDANRDGVSDFYWRNDTSGVLTIWVMNNYSVSSTRSYQVSDVLTFAALGDYNGDGYADILWERKAWRQLSMWQFNGAGSYSGSVVGTYPVGWQVLRGDLQP